MDLISITEFAKKTGYSRQWVYDMINKGLISRVYISDRPFIHKSYLEKYKKR